MEEQLRRQYLEYIVRWEMIFDMLSMERVAPFLPEMGLGLSNVDVIRSIARQFLEQLWQLRGNEEGAKTLVHHTFANIATAADDQTAQTLYQWGMEKFPFGSQKGGLYRWAVLLRWLAGVASQHYPVTPPALDQHKVEAIVGAARKNFGDDLMLEQRLEEAEQVPRSSWEEQLYKSYEDGSSPLHSVSASIENHRTKQTWEFIKALLTNEEMEILLRWAKTHAPHLNLRPESVELPSRSR